MGDGNATISTLTYTPEPQDHGRLLACQAHVEGLSGSIVEDSRRLFVQCKFHIKKMNKIKTLVDFKMSFPLLRK